jgi:lipopolysaccharide heptosyltransferase II/tetraacyldisaccharide 4'-kinase
VKRLPAPVVSVGNLTVGGTGKTPLVAHLARECRRRGLQVVILSRGYGGRRAGVTCVSDGERLCALPPEVGDEALLLARDLPGVPVYTGKDRYSAGLAAWRRHGPHLFLLDDGFQHFQLHRDLDLVLLDAEEPLGNGLLLPAGPLREDPRVLELADLLVLTRFRPERHQAALARFTACFPDKDVLTATLSPVGLRRFPGGQALPLAGLAGQPCLAFAGLARPQVFQETLTELKASLKRWRSFPDHHPYSRDDLAGLVAAAAAVGAQALITTAKDFARMGAAWEESIPLLVLEVAASLEPWEALGARLEDLLALPGPRGRGEKPSQTSPPVVAGPEEPQRAAATGPTRATPGQVPRAVQREWAGLRVAGTIPAGAEKVRQVLLRVPNWLGDAVMALPVLPALKRRFPQAAITVWAAPRVAPLYAHHPQVAATVTPPPGLVKVRELLRLRGRFEVGVALPNSFEAALGLWLAGAGIRAGYAADARRLLLTRAVGGREALLEAHLVYYYLGVLRAFGDVGPEDVTLPRLFLTPAEQQAAGRILMAAGLPGAGPWVGLAPGAAYGPAKRWPAAHFAQAARELAGRAGVRVVLLGGPDDREVAALVAAQAGVPVLNLAGQTSLRQALGVLSRLAALITNDSGLMHAAAALAVPVVAIFGSTNPQATGPFTPRSTLLYRGPDCSPCLKRTCGQGYECLTAITVAEVVAATLPWLEGPVPMAGGTAS